MPYKDIEKRRKSVRESMARRRARDPEFVKLQNLKGIIWRKNNKEAIHKYNAIYNAVHAEERKKKHQEWVKDHVEIIKERNRNRFANNPNYMKLKYASDIQFKLKSVLRARLRMAVKGSQKNGSAVKDLGCSIQEFLKYMESKFKIGMTWQNWGKIWHIDHILPMAVFDLSDPAQLKIVCHYTNLQPLFRTDNLKKGGKIELDPLEWVA